MCPCGQLALSQRSGVAVGWPLSRLGNKVHTVVKTIQGDPGAATAATRWRALRAGCGSLGEPPVALAAAEPVGCSPGPAPDLRPPAWTQITAGTMRCHRGGPRSQCQGGCPRDAARG